MTYQNAPKHAVRKSAAENRGDHTIVARMPHNAPKATALCGNAPDIRNTAQARERAVRCDAIASQPL